MILGEIATDGAVPVPKPFLANNVKILFYNHTGTVSGAERVMLLILAGLNPARFESSVICPANGELSQMVMELGIPFSSIGTLQARFTWRPDHLLRYLISFGKVMLQLRRQVRKQRPDLIHANTIRAGLAITAATVGMSVPVVWHLHDLLPRHPFSVLIRAFAAVSSRARPLAVSHAVAARFRAGWGKGFRTGDGIQVIHNAIDQNRFAQWPLDRRASRAAMGISEQQFAIGVVGQITKRKGQRELICAFARFAPKVSNTVLLVVGAPLFNDDHGYLQELYQLAESLGMGERVIFTGARNDIPTVMQSLDLLVLSSKAEPFGLVVLEAMAAGTPVLANAVDGVPEIIAHSKTGWLVPADDETAMADALLKLAKDGLLLSELAENASAEVLPRFTAEKYFRQIEKFYFDVHGAQAFACGYQDRTA